MSMKKEFQQISSPREADSCSSQDGLSAHLSNQRSAKRKPGSGQKKKLNLIRKGTFSSQQKATIVQGASRKTSQFDAEQGAPDQTFQKVQSNQKLPRKKSTPFGSVAGSTQKGKSPFSVTNAEEFEAEIDYVPQKNSKNPYLKSKKVGAKKLAKSPSNKQFQASTHEKLEAKNPNGRIQDGHINNKSAQQPTRTRKAIPKKKAGRSSQANSARKELEDVRAADAGQQTESDEEANHDLLNDRALELQEKMKQISVYDLY